MLMKNIAIFHCIDMKGNELWETSGGGPIRDAVKWYYMTVGSFYHGIYDGLMGNEPAV